MTRARHCLGRMVALTTNSLIGHLPSHRLRRAWYRRLGLPIGTGSAIHMRCFLWMHGPRSISERGSRIGRNTRINRDCCLDLRGGLVIGDNVSISAHTSILTATHLWRDPGFAYAERPVIIEDHAWIGYGATILPGTRVGRGAVIGAGSVAVGDIPPLAVVSGVPGRVVDSRPEQALDYTLDEPFMLFD